MKLIIPMAGKGTRLRPHTLIKPKPLLQVAGKAMILHLLDYFKDLDISEVVFIVNPGSSEKVLDLLRPNCSFKATCIEQRITDGTAGAIRIAREFITEDVIIIYADTLFDIDLSIINKIRNDSSVDGIFWAKEVEDYQRFGVLVANSSGYITSIVEKPTTPVSKLANIGLYYIKNYQLLLEGIDYLYQHNVTLNNEYFLVHAFQYMIDHQSTFIIAPVKGWYDCGTLPALLETNKILLQKVHEVKSPFINSVLIPPVYVDSGCVIENSIIGPHVSIAKDCIIKNSILASSIINHDTKLTDIKLKDSTLGAHVVLTSTCKKLHLSDYSEVHYD